MFDFIVWPDGSTFCCGRRPQHLRGHSLFAARVRHDSLYPLATAFNLPERSITLCCCDNGPLILTTRRAAAAAAASTHVSRNIEL